MITVYTHIYSLAAGEDFAEGAMEAIFMVGLTSPGQRACSFISIIDDNMVEGDHDFSVSLSSVNLNGVTISVPSSTATVTILDNDGTTKI